MFISAEIAFTSREASAAFRLSRYVEEHHSSAPDAINFREFDRVTGVAKIMKFVPFTVRRLYVGRNDPFFKLFIFRGGEFFQTDLPS